MNIFKKNKLLIFILLFILNINVVACSTNNAKIIVDFTDEVICGFKGTINVTSSINDDVISFSSSDNKIMTVDQFGNVEAKSVGIVIIYIKSQTGSQINHKIEVTKRFDLTNIALELNQPGPYYVGIKYQVSWIFDPIDAITDLRFNYSSLIDFNEDTGEIIFLDEGTFNLACYSMSNFEIYDVLRIEVDYPEDYERYNLLFIGNSLTKYTYDIPQIVTNMIVADGVKVKCTVDSPTPQWIIDHKYSFEQLIKDNKYTHVILQEQSMGPITDFNKFKNAVIEFEEKIKQTKAKTILYQTWCYNLPFFHGDTSLQEEMHKKLENAYQNVAKEIGATVSKVGNAFYEVIINYPEINLYADNNHPSLYGAYLSACVHYGTLTKRFASLNSYKVEGISESVRIVLQKIADEIVFNNKNSK